MREGEVRDEGAHGRPQDAQVEHELHLVSLSIVLHVVFQEAVLMTVCPLLHCSHLTGAEDILHIRKLISLGTCTDALSLQTVYNKKTIGSGTIGSSNPIQPLCSSILLIPLQAC